MSDIVQRLREHNFNNWGVAMELAADEIERLREGLDRIANPHILNEDPREVARMVLSQ